MEKLHANLYQLDALMGLEAIVRHRRTVLLRVFVFRAAARQPLRPSVADEDEEEEKAGAAFAEPAPGRVVLCCEYAASASDSAAAAK